MIGTPQQLERVDSTSIRDSVRSYLRNLGSWFDSRLSKSKHITKNCRLFIFWFVQHTTHQELSLTNINRDTHSLCSFNEHKFCHRTPLIVELHWLPIRFRIVYFKILFITFKFLHGLAPSYLSSLISFRRQTRCNLRNSNHNLLLSYPSFISKLATLGDRSFTYAAPRLCNALPFDVRYTKSVNVFKVKLKHTYLVQYYYYYHNLVSLLFCI